MENCIFFEPLNYQGVPPATSTEYFQFSKATCSSTAEEVIDGNATTSFLLQKSVSYGDIIVIVFLTLFLTFGITKFFVDFFLPKKLDWKQH